MNLSVALRRLGLGVAAAVTIAVALLAGLYVFLHTGPGERWTSGKLEENVPGLELDGYRLGWPFRMRADYLRIKDEQGTWLEATAPELVWHPVRLWRKVLDIDRLSARMVRVHRLPQPAPPDAGGAPAAPPPLPQRLLLEDLRLPVRLEAPVLGEVVELDLNGTAQMERGGGNVEVAARTRQGDLLRIAGVAGLDFVDLRWYLRAPDLGRWQRVAGLPLAGEANGDGVIVGRLPSPELNGRIDVGAGAADRLRWRQLALTGRVLTDGELWRLGLRADVDGGRWNGTALPGTAISLSAAGDLSPAAGRLRLGVARLTTVAGSAEAAGVLDHWGRQATLRLAVNADLAALGAPRVKGRLWAEGAWAGSLTGDGLRGAMNVHGRNVATGIAPLDRALGHSPRGHVVASLRGDRLWLQPSRLTGARAVLTAGGHIAPRLGLWTRLDLPDAGVLAEGMQGGGSVMGGIAGNPQRPAARGVAVVDGVSAGGAPPGYGAVAFDLVDASQPKGVLSAALRVADIPVEATARLDRTRLEQLRISSGRSVVGGSLDFADGVRGRLSGTIPELGDWQRIIGRPVSGRIEADADLDSRPTQTLHLSLRGDALTVADVAVPTARMEITATTERIAVERAELSAAGIPLRLLNTMVIRRQGRSTIVAPATVAIGDGRATIDGRLDGEAVQARLRLGDLPLALAGMDAVGTIDGTVEATGTLAAPRVHFALDGRKLALARTGDAGLEGLSARAVGDWRDGVLSGRADLHSGAALHAQGQGSVRLPGDGTIDARLRLTGDAARLSEALPLAGHMLSGRLDGTASVGGTLDAPRIDGRAELTGGRYENLDYGTVVTGLRATARLDGDRLDLTADGGDAGDGRIRATGTVGLDGGYGGEVTLRRFTALRRDDVEASVNGNLRLNDTGLSGRLAIPRAEVDVGRITGGGPVNLEVVEINRPGAAPPSRAAAAPPRPGGAAEGAATLPLNIDVAVEHAFVRGRGLDSEWQGRLTVAGTADQPSLTGRLVAARGQYDLLGKAFKLTPDSEVVFQGGDTIDPTLAVTAEAATADITAQVRVAGTARAPELTFTSSPPLPQDEVLARLLFGREAGKLSAFQQLQLAQMATGGLTGKGGFDPLGKMRGFLGLDVLGVGSETAAEGKSSPTLSAGKYIAPDTFVRVEQGVAGLGRVTVEQELGGGFAVESSVGMESGGGVGLNWRKDY